MTVRSFDAAGNPSPYVYTNFAASSADVSPPSVSVVSPVNWSSVSVPVVVEGSASDDVGVAGVSLEIYDRDTGLWWNGCGWQVARTGVDALLAGGDWSYSFDPGSPASQPYWVTVRSFDAAGNPSSYVYTNFAASSADVSPPSVSVVSPVNWSSVSVPVVVEGSASDDVGVAGVSLEIYDRDTGLWWNGSGWQVARTGVDALLAGGDWSYSFDPGSPASQPYWVTVRSFRRGGQPKPLRLHQLHHRVTGSRGQRGPVRRVVGDL